MSNGVFEDWDGTHIWERYWSEKEKDYRCLETETFLREEAREKLYHVGEGESLLDFGSGKAELLVYYARVFLSVVGCGFSPAALKAGEERLRRFSCNNSTLVCANDETLWEQLDQKFDRICVAPVVQYFNPVRLHVFIERCLEKLNDRGKIVLFDFIDPRVHLLSRLGIIRPYDLRFRTSLSSIVGSSIKSLKRASKGCVKKLVGGGDEEIRHPSDLCAAFDELGVHVEHRRSMYCEYKYHLILSPRRQEALFAGGGHL